MATGSELFHQGQLQEAIDATIAHVKRKPTDGDQRGFLAELLCLAGDLERADKHLEVMSNQDLDAAPGIALFRQLVRAERSRQEFYTEGRIPEVLSSPTEQLKHHLEAAVLIREGDLEGAAKSLSLAEQLRAAVSGSCDGEPFDDMRDLDDLNAGFLEVLTSTGKYYWVAIDTVNSIEFHPPERPRDILWRRASLDVQDGPDGEVFVPAIYAPLPEDAAPAERLGRSTHWLGEQGQPVRGIGQRVFLLGESDRPIMELTNVRINADT